MFDIWFNFAVIVIAQLLLFIAHACYEKRFHQVPTILIKGIFGGLILGLVFDLTFGKLYGMYSYTVGYDFLSLAIIASLGYGLFVAHVLLMQKATLVNFWVRVMIVATVFEITNFYFPTWTWEFEWTFPEYLFVQSACNFGAAILVASFWHFYFKHKFVFISKLYSKMRYKS